MKRFLVCAAIGCALGCRQEPQGAPKSPFPEGRGGTPVALFSNGGFESGDLSNWTVESFINNGVTYPTVNGTTVPPQTIADLGLATGGVANSSAVGPNSALSQIPNGLSNTTTLRWPIYGSYSAVVNGQHPVSQLNGTYPYGANQNVNSIKQDMVVATSDVDPIDGMAHVRFVVAPVLQNPNHTTTQQPYYFLHVKNLTTGQELFNRFNYVAQAGVPWQTDAGGTIEYLAWQAIDVAAPGLISVGDDVQAQVIASGCSLGGHWGEAYVDAFGAFLPGMSIVARQPQFANEGTNVTATYTVNNAAGTTQTNVVLTLPTPNNATFVSFTPPSGMTCSGIPAAGGTGTISCSIASMSPFSATTFSIVWKANTGLTLPADMGNGSYGVKSDQQAFLLGMPATTYLTDPTAIQYADYSVSIDDGQTSVTAGQALTYTIVVKNNGPATPTGKKGAVASVPVVETNSTGGLNLITWTCAASSGSSCGAASGTGLINSTATLIAGGTATYTVHATAASPSSGSYINNTVAVTTSGLPAGFGDPDQFNNTIGDTDQFGVLINITVNKDGTGNGTGLVSSAPAGISCGTSCTTQTAQFASGAQITLTAVPDSGEVFAGWTAGPCSGSSNPQCSFTPTLATSATAKFTLPSWTITTSSGGNGTIVCSSPVTQGQSSSCTISPASGYALTSLTDNGTNVLGSVVGSSYTISNVQGPHTVVAGFLKTLGTTCGGAGECGSGNCVDGVCCNSACSGQCQACNVNGGGVTPGTCTIVSGAPVGTRPACTSDGSACGGACDGTNATACTYPGGSTACRAASCAAGVQTAASACNGTGTCPASATQSCNPYVCGATACKTSCTGDSDCISGDYCSSGACVPKIADGGACTASNSCVNGNCVDGVCCNSACGGQCQACDVSGSVGVCTTVSGAPHGTRAACSTDGSSCGGSCNGVNAASCTYPTAQCRGASCSAGVETLAASCSGGSCPAVQTQSCGQYICGGTACKTTCATDSDCVSGDWCSSGACVPKIADGGACTASNSCVNGNCVDGVCCNSACGGQCQACDVPGKVGTCSPVSGSPHGTRAACASDGSSCGGACDGSNTAACAYPTSQCRSASCSAGVETLAASCSGGSCPATQTQGCGQYVCGATACKTSCASDSDCISGDYCNAGACVPKIADGGACTASNSCVNGNCVDGVCCNSACGGQCQACDVPGSVGVCTTVSGAPHGTRQACATDGTSCGGSCDGANAASCTYPTAQCRGASCSAGVETLAASCSGGSCPAAQTQGCGQYVCGASACKTSCASDSDCISGDWCSSGACVPKIADGGACSASNSCVDGNCVDGVCCNTACNGQCQACDVPGKVGVCTAVSGAPHGSRQACNSDGSACGGSCDGVDVNACAYPTSQCRGASCSAGVETLAASCGNGSCPAAQTQSCGAFACGATACNTSCAVDADCSSGSYCSSGTCVSKLADGSACTDSSQCANAHCVDGFCCDQACNGQCQACDVGGSVGTCTDVSGAPHGSRPACATDGTLCGGTCDGTSATGCAYPTTTCRDPSCTADVATLGAACDGSGHCPAVQTQSCTPFTCGATACNGNCVVDGDCAAGEWCSGGICISKLIDGSNCSADSQCANSNCVDGVCCNVACGGQCEACDVAGSVGTCTAVGGAPHGARPTCASDGSLCGGACDGANRTACAYPDSSTTCRDASCSSGVATLSAGCNGAGACPATQTQSCSPYTCGPTACKGNCAVDSDCIAGDYCAAGICAPRLVDGAACSGANQCGSGECVDGVCCDVACDGQCQACDVAGSVGTCSPVVGAPHGVRAACASDGSSCGGSCDGVTVTACTFPVSQCRGASCTSGVATLAASCDGAGNCPAVQTQTCAPYQCSGSACAGNCVQNSDCTAGDWCSGGVCVPLVIQGGSCSSDSQCGSGHCVDGVCCDTACNGQCEACSAAGVCSPVVGAPRGGRAACVTDGSSCGGACDGSSRTACAYPVAQCRAQSACVNGVQTDAASCDGAGHCPASVQESCGSTPPQASCATDKDCAATDYCSNGICKPRGQWIVAGAGGCTSTGTAAWPLVVILLAFMARRRKLAVAALVVAGAAQAQSTSFTVDRFQPGTGAYDVLGVSSPETARDLDWHASLYGDYARDPLRLIAVGAPDQVRLLRSQSMLHLGGSIGFGERFEIGAVLPIALAQGSGAAPQIGLNSIASGGLGDLRLLPKVRLFTIGPVVLGAGLPVTLPTGRSDAFLSQGSFTAAPTALVELQLPVRVLANLGIILRPGQQLTNLDVGNALSYGIATEAPIARRLSAILSLQGEANFGGGGAVERPMELMAGLRWSVLRGVDFVGGGGPGLTNGYGTPRYRVFFSLALTPDMLPSKRLALPPLQPEPVMEMPPAMAVVESPPTAVISSTQFETQEPELAKLDADDNKIELLAPVNFKNDKDVLAPESRGVLDAAAAVLAAHPEIERVRIEGHTDNKGKPKYNKGLSDRRAKAVMRYLIAKGIEAQRLTSEGFGDTRPVMPNATEAGRAKNRRVELVIIGMKLAARASP